MTERMAADDLCEHHYETRILGGQPITVGACIFCRTPDWADLREQAAELYRWGWQEGRDGKAARETLSAYDKPRQAQDGPHGPQDGPERPDVAAETPDGTGGRQTGAEPLARLQRLRDQLAAEHAKVVAADQHPRPDLDHLRVTPHNGIGVGLEIALFFADHHLREAGEEARTTPDNPVASEDAADNPLREQIQAAIEDEIYEYRERTMFWEEGGVTIEIARLATRGAMEAVEREMEQLRADANAWRHKAIRRALAISKLRGTIDACIDLADEPVTDRTGWGDGYRAAIGDLREFGHLEPAAAEPGEQP